MSSFFEIYICETKILNPIVISIKTIVAEYPSIVHDIETILHGLYLGNEEHVPDVLAEFVHMIIQRIPNMEITYNINISDFVHFFTHCRLCVISCGTHSKEQLEILTETVKSSIQFFETNVFSKLRKSCGNEILDLVFKGNTVDVLQGAATKLEQLIEHELIYASRFASPTKTCEEVNTSVIEVPKKSSVISSDSSNDIPTFAWNSVKLDSLNLQPPIPPKRESSVSSCMSYLLRRMRCCATSSSPPKNPEKIKSEPIYCERCNIKLKKINNR